MNLRNWQDPAGVENQSGRGGAYSALILGGLFLLAAFLYALQQARLPAAGAILIPNVANAWQLDGVAVQVLGARHAATEDTYTEGVEVGDVIVAIDGRPLREWASLVARGRSQPSWQEGEVVPMKVRRAGREMTVDVRLGAYPLLAALSETWSALIFGVVTFVVGAFVFWRRPWLPAARIVFLWGASLLGAMTWALGLDVAQLMNSSVFWLYTATACAAYLTFWSSGLHLSLIFPSPHPWLRGHEARAWLVHALVVGVTVAIAAARLLSGDPLNWISAFLRSVDLVALPTGALMILMYIWGYRRYYDEDARRRARIFLFAAIICGGTGIIVWNLAPLIMGKPLISPTVAGLLLIPAPLAMAVSIVRYRLFDIDVIIRRTLIYTLLTAALAMIYFASVVVLQNLLGVFSGDLSNLAIVLSTLAIAGLFSPLRRAIQTAIDRRFYRSKYDARETVAEFANVARSKVDLDAISEELVQLIQKTVQPKDVSLWLAKPPPSGATKT